MADEQFDPVWASSEGADITEPTGAEIAAGFECGPADPGVFNWLFREIMSRINGLGVADKASKFIRIATTEGISGGGDLQADRTLRLNFPGLTEETSIANDDLIAIYDESAGAHRKMTRVQFVAGLGGGTGGSLISGVVNVGGGPGEIFDALDGSDIRLRTIEGDGLSVITDTGNDKIVIAIDNMASELTY